MTQQDPAFSEILAALRAEETEPTYSALSRWQKRYPQFRDDLEDYFANWATTFAADLKLDDRDTKDGPNERWLADFGVAYAMQIMRRQQAGIPDNRIEPLTDFEQLVLTAISVQRTPRWRYLDRIADTVRELGRSSPPAEFCPRNTPNAGRAVPRLLCGRPIRTSIPMNPVRRISLYPRSAKPR